MTFEFSTPEGVPVKCDTIEELVEGYSRLWRNKKKPGRVHGGATVLDEVGIEKLLTPNSEKLFMPRHWKKVFDVLVEFGDEGTTITEISEILGRNRNTVASVFQMMSANKLIEEHPEGKFLWRIPENIRDHRTFEGKLG